MNLILFLIFSITAFLIFFYYKRILKKKEVFKFNKNNLNKWMNLSKKERFDLSKKDSIIYLNERKNLLKKIRDEYKNISKEK